MKDYKTAILPIVTVGCLAVGSLTGHPVSQNLQTEIVEIASVVVAGGISIWGIIKNHKKAGK